MVKLSQSPIDQLEDFFVMVDDDVLRFDISVHDASAVAEIQSLH